MLQMYLTENHNWIILFKNGYVWAGWPNMDYNYCQSDRFPTLDKSHGVILTL